MSYAQTKFSAAQNGFHFINRFDLHFPVKYTLPLGGTIDLNDVVFGLCGGMCFAALDYFYLGKEQPQEAQVDDIDSKLYIYLCERQLDSLKVSVLVKLMEWMLLDNREIAARMGKYEIPRLKKLLEKGQPVVLALVRVQGSGDPTQNHQVLATGYNLNPLTKDLSISLYDPNYPARETALTLNLGKGNADFKVTHSMGDPLRGFFIIPYTPQRPLWKVMQQMGTLADEETGRPDIHLKWPVDSRRVNQYFGENPETYRPFKLPGHEGLDLYALDGANVYAAADGEVYEADHPSDHPYGLQVRIKHETGATVYRTVYAHLKEAFVRPGQQVHAGERIGTADSTGNSFGAHLHLTLKIDGAQTPGYPAGIVDPWPYLQETPPPAPLPAVSGVTVFTTGEVNLRAGPNTQAEIIALLPAGEPLDTLGEAADIRGKIGVQGEWLEVKTASGQAGYVAAWLAEGSKQAFPPSDLVVYPNDTANLRSGPGTGFPLVATLALDDPLTVMGDASVAEGKLGRMGEWIQVQTQDGKCGFVAAWLVHKTGQTPPASGLVVIPVDLLSVRARPTTDANVLTVVTPGDGLVVLGDKAAAEGKIGQAGQWLNVRTPGKFTGYVAAWLVKQKDAAIPPAPPSGAGLKVYPTADINIRAQASANSPRVTGAFFNEPLTVIEADLETARQKVGKTGEWVYVEAKNGTRGWAAGWFLGLTST